jgi:hypothetical protein
MTGWSQPAGLAAASAHEDRKFGLKEAVDTEGGKRVSEAEGWPQADPTVQ